MPNNVSEIFNSFDIPPLDRFLKRKEVGISLSLTGLNNPLRLLALNKINKNHKKENKFSLF